MVISNSNDTLSKGISLELCHEKDPRIYLWVIQVLKKKLSNVIHLLVFFLQLVFYVQLRVNNDGYIWILQDTSFD